MQPIRTLIALVAFAAAGLAQAQEATPFPNQPSTSGKSRAEVVAETHAALASGRLDRGNEGPAASDRVVSTRDRDSVRMEAAASIRRSALEQQRERIIVGM